LPYQIPFIEENLTNSEVILDENDLTTKLMHPIFYTYSIGEYRLETLVGTSKYQYPLENPHSRVKIDHDGTVKIQDSIDKLSFLYDFTRDFENVYDYNNPSSKITKVLIRNDIKVYHYRHKLFINTNNKNAKNIISCIKNSIIKQSEINKVEIPKETRRKILYCNKLNIDNFMKYLVENYSANVKAIYAGNMPQRENKAIVIYGEEADKSHLYEYIRQQGSELSCITVKLQLNTSAQPRNILFNNTGGVMLFGYVSEELALQIVLECNKIVESFLNDSSYN
jgi:hypothetical protein